MVNEVHEEMNALSHPFAVGGGNEDCRASQITRGTGETHPTVGGFRKSQGQHGKDVYQGRGSSSTA